MTRGIEDQNAPTTPRVHALRTALAARGPTLARHLAAFRVRLDLADWIHSHPKAPEFLLDAGTSFERMWYSQMESRHELVRRPRPNLTRPLQLARGLVALDDRVDSFLMAVSTCVLVGHRIQARALLAEGLTRHGPNGHAASLLLWSAYLDLISGNTRSAMLSYLAASAGGFGPVRVTSSIAGALLAQDKADSRGVHELCDVLGHEDPQTVTACAVGLRVIRARRCTQTTIASDLDRLARASRDRGIPDSVCYSLAPCASSS